MLLNDQKRLILGKSYKHTVSQLGIDYVYQLSFAEAGTIQISLRVGSLVHGPILALLLGLELFQA